MTFSVPARLPRFLVSPVDEIVQAKAFTDVERPDSLWGVDLVSRKAGEIDAKGSDVDVQFPQCLHHIGMKRDFLFPCDAGYITNGHYRACLVIGVHDGDQNGVFRDGTPYVVRVDKAMTVDGKVRNGEASRFQVPADVEDRGVFHR